MVQALVRGYLVRFRLVHSPRAAFIAMAARMQMTIEGVTLAVPLFERSPCSFARPEFRGKLLTRQSTSLTAGKDYANFSLRATADLEEELRLIREELGRLNCDT